MDGATEWQHMTDRERIVRLEQQVIAIREERDKQAKEYERRLHDLNNENARLAADAAVYARQDVVNPLITNLGAIVAATKEQQDARVEVLTDRLKTAEARTAANRILFGTVATILIVVVAVLTFLLANT